MRLSSALVLCLLLLVPACGDAGDDSGGRIRLATTTSTRDSGLLTWLLAPFGEETGIEVDVIGVGTGRALALGRTGDADVVLVHARTLEDRFVADGHGVDRRDVMWNDFVLVGPKRDPAGIEGTADPVEAMKKIAASKAKFISRGDNSGTHVREQALWEAAGLDPTGSDGWPAYYWKTGQGMGPCLTMADEKGGYTLADRGTYLAFRDKLDLAVLVEGDPSLRNPYGVILVNPERHGHVNHADAKRFAEWLTSPAGQARIAAFRRDGDVLFHPAGAQ